MVCCARHGPGLSCFFSELKDDPKRVSLCTVCWWHATLWLPNSIKQLNVCWLYIYMYIPYNIIWPSCWLQLVTILFASQILCLWGVVSVIDSDFFWPSSWFSPDRISASNVAVCNGAERSWLLSWVWIIDVHRVSLATPTVFKNITITIYYR